MDLEAILNTKWSNDTLDKNGKLKPHILYGNHREKEVEKGSVFLYVGDLAPGAREKVTAFVREFMKLNAGCHLYIKRSEAEHFSVLGGLIRATNPPEHLFAVSETIVAVGSIPNYFAARPEQKLWFICGGFLDGADRDRRAKGLISNLLNAAVIVTLGEDMAEQVRREFGMDELFTGKMVSYHGEIDALAEELSAYMRSGESERFFEIGLAHGKKKILIYCNWNGKGPYREYAANILDGADPDAYDVTLLLYRKVTAFEMQKLLDMVDPRVRVIYRMNTFSASAEDFIGIQSEMEKIYDNRTAEEYLEKIRGRVLETELQRLLGNAEFDAFIYCAPYDKLWYLMARYLKAAKKKKIELDTNFMTLSEDEEDKNYRANMIKARMDVLLFDELVAAGHVQAEQYREFFRDQELPVSVCDPGSDARKYRGDRTLFDGEERYVIEYPSETFKKEVMLWKAPGANSAVIDAERSDLGELLARFRSGGAGPDSICVLNGDAYDVSKIVREYQAEDTVFHIPGDGDLSRRFLPDYCGGYAAYYTTDEHDDSLIGMMMEAKGKKTVLLKDGHEEPLRYGTDPDEARASRICGLFS